MKTVDRPNAHTSLRIAMIGTGLAGLMCSRILHGQGLQIKCFEKSHRVGGRASTRIANGQTQFDHGAQYFTIREAVLKPFLESWCADSHVAKWNGHIVSIDAPAKFEDVPMVPRYVGTPCMESLATHLSTDLSIEVDTEIANVQLGDGGYRLTSKTGRDLGEFDIVLWNCPPRQVEKLVPLQTEWQSELSKVEMIPCWAVMLAFDYRWEVPCDGAFVNGGVLSWIARDSSKPARSTSFDTWVLHSSVTWAANNLELSVESTIECLTEEAERMTGIAMPVPQVAKAHRWLYSRPTESLTHKSLWDEVNRLGACGDWCGGPRVEGALKSGMALADQVLSSLI